MSALSIAASGLFASQTALDTIGQNLANLNTPGYDNEVANLTETVYGAQVGNGGQIGDGVTVTSITRQDDPLLDAAYNTSQSAVGSLAASVPLLDQAQTYLNSGTGFIDGQLNTFYNSVQALTADPSNKAQTQVVLDNLQSVTNTFQQASNNLSQLQFGSETQLNAAVTSINGLTAQIASLNQQIQNATASDANTNGLEDTRDNDINQLAQYVDVRTIAQPDGTVNVLGTGVGLVVGNIATNLAVGTDANNNTIITASGATAQLSPQSGQLAGLLTFINQTAPSFTSQLNTLAQGFIQALNTVQATGLTTAGPQSTANGSLAVSSPTALLSASGTTQFPVQAGTLYVSVTSSTGTVVDPVTVNPATQSLQSFASAFQTATGLTATVNANNTLSITAPSGTTFSFSGQSPTSPTTNTLAAGSTGVAPTPTLTGIYDGSGNTNYTFTVSGAGTVGSGSLSLAITNGAGTNVANLSIGSGYTPGTPLSFGNGLSIQLSAGSVTSGSFSYPAVSQPDTSGILAALGINTLLTGTSAVNIAVNATILGNPGLLASTTTGQPGDTSNLQRLLATGTQNLLSSGTQTFTGYYASLVGGIGSTTQQAQNAQTTQTSLNQQISDQRQSVSGVNSDQETIDMLTYQRAYEASAKFLTTINQTLDSLLAAIQ